MAAVKRRTQRRADTMPASAHTAARIHQRSWPARRPHAPSNNPGGRQAVRHSGDRTQQHADQDRVHTDQDTLHERTRCGAVFETVARTHRQRCTHPDAHPSGATPSTATSNVGAGTGTDPVPIRTQSTPSDTFLVNPPSPVRSADATPGRPPAPGRTNKPTSRYPPSEARPGNQHASSEAAPESRTASNPPMAGTHRTPRCSNTPRRRPTARPHPSKIRVKGRAVRCHVTHRAERARPPRPYCAVLKRYTEMTRTERSGFYETPWAGYGDTEIRSHGRLGRLPRRLTARAGVPVDVTRGLETGLDGEDRRLRAPRRSAAVDGFRHGLARPCDLGATHVVANRRRRHAQTAGNRRDAQRRRQAQPRPARVNWMNVVGRPACRWATPGDVHQEPGPYAPRPRGKGYDNAGTGPLSGSAVCRIRR